jgi:ribonuclease-3
VIKNNFERLERRLGYRFKDPQLLTTALTHRSYSINHNERLEFLGDSILNFTIAEELFCRFPDAREGQLSRLRSMIVKGETLAELAREFEIGDCLNLGEGELKSGGFRRASILADSVEAVIGAIYFDSSMTIIKSLIVKWFDERLTALSLELNSTKDAKSVLQEWLQGRKQQLPLYDVVEVSGELHNQTYTVSCSVAVSKTVTSGTASNRKAAEKIAAEAMIEVLKIG